MHKLLTLEKMITHKEAVKAQHELDIEWVAEHLMKFERKHCQGQWGGASVTCATWGGNLTNEYKCWTWCDWCGYCIEDGKSRPCPEYPFPEFSLIDLMRKLAQFGVMIQIRNDALRESNLFTLIDKRGRICDTDDPFGALCSTVRKKYAQTIDNS